MAWINFLEFVYPVGSVYFSTINTSPASVIGGTWSQLTGGMLGLAGSAGVAAAGSDGGSRKISVDQMPSHSHVEVALVKKDSGNTTIPPWTLYINDRWASGGIVE